MGGFRTDIIVVLNLTATGKKSLPLMKVMIRFAFKLCTLTYGVIFVLYNSMDITAGEAYIMYVLYLLFFNVYIM